MKTFILQRIRAVANSLHEEAGLRVVYEIDKTIRFHNNPIINNIERLIQNSVFTYCLHGDAVYE